VLLIVGDAEIVGELRVEFGRMLGDVLNHGAARAALEQGAQAVELIGPTDGVHLDTTVAQIAHESGEMQAFGFILSEIAEADTLNDSGNEVAAGRGSGAHQIKNCNRGRGAVRGGGG
jgi:hypothetical protein